MPKSKKAPAIKSRYIMQMSVQNVEWSDDSSRKAKPCMKCKKPTTGRVVREARCLECTMEYALSPLAGLANLLRMRSEQ